MGRGRKITAKVPVRAIIGLVVIGLLWIPACVGKTFSSGGPSEQLEHQLRALGKHNQYLRNQAIRALRGADLAALQAFREHFAQLSFSIRQRFRQEVIPYLPARETDRFLLEEFRKGLATHRAVEALRDRRRQEEMNVEIAKAYQRLENDYRWWEWVVRAKPDLGFASSYEEVYSVYVEQKERGFPAKVLARALFRLDAKRALADVEKLLKHPDAQMQRRGVWAFDAVERLPKPELWKHLFTSCDRQAQEEATQLMGYARREHVELLLPLLSNPSERVRSEVEYRLGRIGYMTREQIGKIRSKSWTPAERVAWWKQWWKARKGLSEEALQEQGLKALLTEAKENLTRETLFELARYPDRSEIYPVFLKALSSSERGLPQTASMQLGNLAVRGYTGAADTLIDYCSGRSARETVWLADTLARIKDPRAVPLLLEMLQEAPEEDKDWHRRVLIALGKTGDKRALEVILRLVIEEGDLNAAYALPRIEGSETTVPKLLQAIVNEKNPKKREAIQSAIKRLGDSRIGLELTRLLPKAEGGPEFREGPRFELLQLMEMFPDAAAKPLLLGLLKTDERWTRLYAARVLGRLGDYSGVPGLIEDIAFEGPVEANYYYQIGNALRDIGSPDTRTRLLAFFGKSSGNVRYHALDVIVQQEDPAYIDLFERLVGDKDEELSRRAAWGIARLVLAANKNRDRDLVTISERDLPPIRSMLLWAFLDRKIQSGDVSFPDRSIRKLKGAVATVGRWQYIQFKMDGQAVELIDLKGDQSPLAPDGSTPSRQGPYAAGSVNWVQEGKYLVLELDINCGGASYLFRQDRERWVPVRLLGWSIE